VRAEAGRILGFEPEVRFIGSVDRSVGPDAAADSLATLREALSNVARHAHARHAKVEVVVLDDLHLRVVDDGTGVSQNKRTFGRGLPNMAERAEALGGTFMLNARTEGGTELSWRVPLD
jgi:signal transduction histidine kinase